MSRDLSDKSLLKAMLVDPSLFTAPYDAALTEGLLAAGVEPMWMTRPTRKADRQELPIERTDPHFYRRVDEAEWLPHKLKPVAKGAAHLVGLVQLLWKVRSRRPDVVHFQWIVVPPLDILAMKLIRLWCPVVLTVHDTVAFNGERLSWLQRLGHDAPTRVADRVIVHTRSGHKALVDRGIPSEKITVIPHGALRLPVEVQPMPAARDPRWTFVLFGEIKPYKGLDTLIEAVATLPAEVRRQMRVVVAGRPRMDMEPLHAQIARRGVSEQFDLRLERQTEEEMATLFVVADSFVFPYRQIDASGVYFLVKSLGKWLIASRVGIFEEDIVAGVEGELVTRDDAAALASALRSAVETRPRREPVALEDVWLDIGRATRRLYERAITEYKKAREIHDGRFVG
jgi:glycosyltransferase involved in cell wall biosynthesis